MQIRRRLLGMVEDGNAFHVLGANFLAAYVAGSLAAAATCPLDVAKTRRQIEVGNSSIRKMCLVVYIIKCFRTSSWMCKHFVISVDLVFYRLKLRFSDCPMNLWSCALSHEILMLFQNDPEKMLKTTTKNTLLQVWRFVCHFSRSTCMKFCKFDPLTI